MGTGARRFFIGLIVSGGLLGVAALPATVQAASCGRPSTARKVTQSLVTAFKCEVKNIRQLRTDLLGSGKPAYDACVGELKSNHPQWQVVDEDGTSMTELAQVSLPAEGEAEAGLGAYLGQFGGVYHGHELFLLKQAITEYKKAKLYTDAFAQEMARAGQALKSHDCGQERDIVMNDAHARDADANGAENIANANIEALAG